MTAFKNKPLKALLVSALVLGSAAGVTANGDETTDEDAKASEKPLSKSEKRAVKRMAKIMEDYEYTGEVKSCVNLRFLKQSKVIDDQTIFFEGIGDKGYMVDLPRRCIRLGFEQRFAYKTSTSQLCKHDILTVLDSYGRAWGSCGMGTFKVMKELPSE